VIDGPPVGPDGVPEAVVPEVPRAVSLAPFVLADGSRPPRDETEVRLARSVVGLHVSFRCRDRDIWGTHRGRDEPLWEEEAVEVFLSPGPDDPARYFEFEFNPFGAIFDAMVENPRGDRTGMRVDASWNCEGIERRARIEPALPGWCVDVTIPWRGVCDSEPPTVWRANFFRIERSRGRPAEFSAWSCPRTDPPDFHRPRRFGRLRLDGATGGRGCSTRT
jgi:hypothetical protein